MSNHSIKFHKNPISSLSVILLTDKQTHRCENKTSLASITFSLTHSTFTMPCFSNQKVAQMSRWCPALCLLITTAVSSTLLLPPSLLLTRLNTM